MSAIAALFNVPSTPEELAVWASAHMSHHRDLCRVIYETTNGTLVLPEYVLDPINPFDSGVWAYQHQSMHQDLESVLGINGFDLTEVDFKNTSALVGWINLNANVHFQASNILEIG